ncbi:2-oxoacid ferredoxin oxidoreductase [candidate division CPR3 bacterium 4484_211]|uniref:2-oxoacid ferredoxin oxidoreductase n=1 Tax=candidate division CPR3 bacterium 4484_211 TaxID=1968527 RepID=A0A1W9NY83_UNCC3|nr:MAG: 2-oxoacid ferredoxin oxidoreductase [candidate division CPR3 bacterium 4484_211]
MLKEQAAGVPTDLNTHNQPTWCPGCGNFGIFTALKNAFLELSLDPSTILCVEGIGCHGHVVNFLQVNHFEGLHGRPLPIAQGAKLANHELNVFVLTGDGDCLGEGGNHFLHALRRNVDLVCLIHNNQRYSLTTGQTSPTTEQGDRTKTSLKGVLEKPVNPVALAIASGGGFVARGFAGDVDHLAKMIVAAHRHKGFAVVDILQPCVTFNKLNTFDYFLKRVYKLGEQEGYQPNDKQMAFKKSLEWGERIPIGIFYQEERPVYEEQLPQLAHASLVESKVESFDFEKILQVYS